MNNIKFSIIVPVYNVENYLRECLDSILNQTYKNFEIILVDDGSKDGSPQICDEYEDKDSRIKVIHKENGGLSDARNHGIEAATGDYLVFVDSDDWIGAQALQHFGESIKKSRPDVLITRLIEIFPEENKTVYKDKFFEDYLKEGQLNKERAIDWICKRSQSAFPSVKYITRRDMIISSNLRFLKGRLHEDMDWTSELCYMANTFEGCVYPWYFHRMNREGAITASLNKKHFIDMIEMAKIHYDKMRESNDELHRTVLNRFMSSVYAWLRYTRSLNDQDLKDVAEAMKQNNVIFKIAPQIKHKVFSAVFRLFGGNVALKTLRLY